MRTLLDSGLSLEPAGQGYPGRVIASPGGEARAEFDLPFTRDRLDNLLLRIEASIGRARRKVRRIETQERSRSWLRRQRRPRRRSPRRRARHPAPAAGRSSSG